MRVSDDGDFFVLFLIFSQSGTVDKIRNVVVVASAPSPDKINKASMSFGKNSPQINDVDEIHVIASNVNAKMHNIHTLSVVIEREAYLPPYAGKRILT